MRLIDADALLEKLRKTDRYFMLKFDIESAPTVELQMGRMSHEYAPEDFCPRCGEKLQPRSMFRVDLCRNWNDTKIKSFIICHKCLRNIEEYINSHPNYNRHGFDLSKKRNELLGYANTGTLRRAILAEPDRPTGKWIEHFNKAQNDYDIECSECSVWQDWRLVRRSFCPNCGAKMEQK